MSNISYLTKTLTNKKVFIRKDVQKILLLAFDRIETKIAEIKKEINNLKTSQSYQTSDLAVQKELLKALDKQLTSEKKRLKWFEPLKTAAINDNQIIDLVFKMFKKKDLEFAECFGDLYSLEKIHQILIGNVAYNPHDANTNILALVEFIIDKNGKPFKTGEFFNFYNDLKSMRGETDKQKRPDTTLTQTGKIFATCERLGLGSIIGKPNSKVIPAIFTVNFDSVLLNHIASKQSQGALKAIIQDNTSKQ